MRKLLARVGLPALAIAALALTTATSAQADPPYQGYHWCNGPIQIAPEISTTTCVNAVFTNSGEHFYNASVRVRNTSATNSVTARPDLLVGPTTYFGSPITIAPGTENWQTTNEILNPPSQPTGRGYIQSLSWWTYTYSR